jgi:hypothetical protein
MSFIYLQCSAAKVLAVKPCKGRRCLILGWHFNKTESSGLTSELILYNGYGFNLTKSLKSLL